MDIFEKRPEKICQLNLSFPTIQNQNKLKPRRIKKFEKVAVQRQFNLTVILENVHDPHNIGAVLRSCDAVGIREIFVIYSDVVLSQETLEPGKKSSTGAGKWVDIHYFSDPDPCFQKVRENYEKILCTSLSGRSAKLYDLDLTQSLALLFGNEHKGVSKESLRKCDGNFVIPQMGMVESLNISVACAVTLFEAARQRIEKNLYKNNTTNSTAEKKQLFEEYVRRHELALELRKQKRSKSKK